MVARSLIWLCDREIGVEKSLPNQKVVEEAARDRAGTYYKMEFRINLIGTGEP